MGASSELVLPAMRKFVSVVITLTGSALWLIGTYFLSFVVFGERRVLRGFIGSVAIAGFGAAILVYGRAVNRSLAFNSLSVAFLLAALALVMILVYGSKDLTEHLEFVFVGVVTGVFLWVWKVSLKNKKEQVP
jgi:drug/metabolite transporter (DMT)-like permease